MPASTSKIKRFIPTFKNHAIFHTFENQTFSSYIRQSCIFWYIRQPYIYLICLSITNIFIHSTIIQIFHAFDNLIFFSTYSKITQFFIHSAIKHSSFIHSTFIHVFIHSTFKHIFYAFDNYTFCSHIWQSYNSFIIRQLPIFFMHLSILNLFLTFDYHTLFTYIGQYLTILPKPNFRWDDKVFPTLWLNTAGLDLKNMMKIWCNLMRYFEKP